jgi:hypothetical protein
MTTALQCINSLKNLHPVRDLNLVSSVLYVGGRDDHYATPPGRLKNLFSRSQNKRCNTPKKKLLKVKDWPLGEKSSQSGHSAKNRQKRKKDLVEMSHVALSRQQWESMRKYYLNPRSSFWSRGLCCICTKLFVTRGQSYDRELQRQQCKNLQPIYIRAYIVVIIKIISPCFKTL